MEDVFASAAAEVDCRGLKCPQPVLRIKRAFSKMPPGTQLLAVCTDELSVIDVPHFASTAGLQLLSQKTEGAEFHFLIKS